MVEYLRSMQEKVKTSNEIPIEQVEKIIYVSIKYSEVMHWGSILKQMWQKLEIIESLTKEQFWQHNGINNKFIVLKKKQIGNNSFSSIVNLSGNSIQRKNASSFL